MKAEEAIALAKSRPDQLHALILAWQIELQDEWIRWATQRIEELEANQKAR